MAQINEDSRFLHYLLSPDEARRGQQLNVEQVMVLKARQAVYAEEKINLFPEPGAIRKFIQREAELRGKIDLIQELIDNSLAASKNVVDSSSGN